MRLRRAILTVSAIPFIAAISAISDISAISPTAVFVQAPDTATLYRINCQMCHGPNGKALIPEMAFIGRKWKNGTKSTDMAKIIADGVTGTPMMPFKAKLTPEQIKALARHVRAFDTTLPREK